MSLAGLSLTRALGNRQQGEVELVCSWQAVLDSGMCSSSATCLSFPSAVAEHPLCPAAWAWLPSGLREWTKEGVFIPAAGLAGQGSLLERPAGCHGSSCPPPGPDLPLR